MAGYPRTFLNYDGLTSCPRGANVCTCVRQQRKGVNTGRQRQLQPLRLSRKAKGAWWNSDRGGSVDARGGFGCPTGNGAPPTPGSDAPGLGEKRQTRSQRTRLRRDLRHRRRGFQEGLLSERPAPPPLLVTLQPPPGLPPPGLHCGPWSSPVSCGGVVAPDASGVPVPGLFEFDCDFDEAADSFNVPCVLLGDVSATAATSEVFQSSGEEVHEGGPKGCRSTPTAAYAASQVALIRRHLRSIPSAAHARAQVKLIKQYRARAEQRQKQDEDMAGLAKESVQLLAHFERAKAVVSDFDDCQRCALCDGEVWRGRAIGTLFFCLLCEAEARKAVQRK